MVSGATAAIDVDVSRYQLFIMIHVIVVVPRDVRSFSYDVPPAVTNLSSQKLLEVPKLFACMPRQQVLSRGGKDEAFNHRIEHAVKP